MSTFCAIAHKGGLAQLWFRFDSFGQRGARKLVKYQREGRNLSVIWADGLLCDPDLSEGRSMNPINAAQNVQTKTGEALDMKTAP